LRRSKSYFSLGALCLFIGFGFCVRQHQHKHNYVYRYGLALYSVSQVRQAFDITKKERYANSRLIADSVVEPEKDS